MLKIIGNIEYYAFYLKLPFEHICCKGNFEGALNFVNEILLTIHSYHVAAEETEVAATCLLSFWISFVLLRFFKEAMPVSFYQNYLHITFELYAVNTTPVNMRNFHI